MNYTKWSPRFVRIILTSVFCLCALPGVSRADSIDPTVVQANHMTELNLAGLRGERTRIPEMLQELNVEDPYRLTTDFTTPMVALARLGAVEALPAFDAILSKYPETVGVYAKAYRARLVVEAAQGRAPLPSNQAAEGEQTLKQEPVVRAGRALSKMRALLVELNMDADSIRRDLVTYEQNRGKVKYDGWPTARYALDQIADIAYQEGYTPDKDADDINSLDFSKVPADALKMRLASLPRPQRIAWLIDDLTIKHEYTRMGPAYSIMERYEEQLLLDEGPDIGPLLAARYTDITTHPDKYAQLDKAAVHPKSARNAMLAVISNLGDNRQASLFLQFHRQIQRAMKQPVFTPKEEDYLAQLDQHKRLVVAGY